MKRIGSPSDLADVKKSIRDARDRTIPCITVCGGTGCKAFGMQRVYDALADEIGRRGIGDKVTLKATGCHGFCERGPVMVIQPEDIFYQSVSADDAQRIIDETVLGGRIIEDLVYGLLYAQIVHGRDNLRFVIRARAVHPARARARSRKCSEAGGIRARARERKREREELCS